ncbi:DEAD/DEAH box helicase [Limibacillus halophilus]|uniref:Type III restriction enzyme n=1 Tax=Limibacillus halophilus TaxID=1579333 RepID=A0A839SQ42_9PROT|nr:DEAD/DEAH box helicase family protein [Limibacillus halophilus]MBB3063964.1 type III restriction enzyme [Limibacillus halophilus]
MFRQLDYQDRVLTTLDDYLDFLKGKKTQADKIAALAIQNPDLGLTIPDFAKEAWEALKVDGKLPASRAAIPFSPRMDGCNRPVPNTVLKVPTGGGKTWLAVSAVSKIMSRYLDRNAGFILWIVPNEAIYTQTLKHLKDREHPYRQALDRAAAGRVRIMEKSDRLDARDVETHLCIMILMLQSSNRENQDTLKMFQDRGDVHGFFPPEGEQQAHKAALDHIPNLSAYFADTPWPMIKESLGNALRTIRPVVVMDEGHRAVSDLAFATLYGFNPCFVLELTATPQDVQPRGGRNPREGRYANVLVEVTGRELDREGMIKMPLNLDPRQGNDWKATLNAAVAKITDLDKEAKKLQADTGRYIRPIMLIQVERTGADQRESGHIHADDVKEWLLTAGFDEAAIAIKTAEQNDLNQPENLDLLAPTNRVRAIITKQALQEGWDCPFAYVLCALAANSNLNAMTQLVGRILRQPGAIKTDIAALDECHVITHRADTATVVEAIKDGLEKDGLGDFVLQVSQGDSPMGGKVARNIDRRPAFASTEIYLPKVMIADSGDARELDYETDILSCIDWRGFDPTTIAARIPENAQAAESQLQRIKLGDDGDELLVGETVSENSETLTFQPAHAVRMISDIVPNPFVGREIVGSLLAALTSRGFDDAKLGRLASLIVEELRKGLDSERAVRAEALFKEEVTAGRIQFRLRLDGRNWRMPFAMETTEPENARQLLSRSGGALEKSLFTPVYENELNGDERDVAVYLDGEQALSWWHRNVARSQYGIQGWKKAKIYPDFIFAVQGEGEAKRIRVLETKGDQLDNLDTAYKRNVLAFLSENFAWDESTPAGELELIQNDGVAVECTLILMSEWKSKLPSYL